MTSCTSSGSFFSQGVAQKVGGVAQRVAGVELEVVQPLNVRKLLGAVSLRFHVQ